MPAGKLRRKVDEVMDRKKSFIQIRHTQHHSRLQLESIVDPAAHRGHGLEESPTRAWFRQKAAQITGAIADERHSIPRESGEHHLPLLAVTQCGSRAGMDDFEQQVRFPQVIAVPGLAFDPPSVTHFRHPIMGVDFTTPNPGKLRF